MQRNIQNYTRSSSKPKNFRYKLIHVQAAPLNSLQQFRVITNGLPKADLTVAITSPSGSRIKAHVIPTAEGFLVNFTPTQLGEYLLSICFGGTPITPQPFRLQCLGVGDSTKVRAFGPGLERGLVGQPAEFMIDTRGAGQGGLGVTVEGPCEAAINCRDNGDGTCNVAYLPTEPGDYTVNITFNDCHIMGSPFQPFILPLPNLHNTRVSGIGIQPHGRLSLQSHPMISVIILFLKNSFLDVCRCSCINYLPIVAASRFH